MSTTEERKANAMMTLKKMTKIQIRLGMKLALVMMQEGQKLPELTPLMDGTIDPGDHDLVVDHMMSFLNTIPEYLEISDFCSNDKQRISEMYQFLAEVSQDENVNVVDFIQRAGMEISIEQMFAVMIQLGLLEDKREGVH